MKYRTPREIETAVARFFGIRENLIVPNVSWGLGLHECDMLIVTHSGYATEVEIKISRGDLKKDMQKGHDHESDKIKKLYFAIPEKLKDWALTNSECIEKMKIRGITQIRCIRHLLPDHAGLISVSESGVCKIVKPCVVNKNARALNDGEMYQIARLGIMRIWSLKTQLMEAKSRRSMQGN